VTDPRLLDVEVAEDRDAEHMLINMGPQHPSTHGVLRLILELDGWLARYPIDENADAPLLTPEREAELRALGYIHGQVEGDGEKKGAAPQPDTPSDGSAEPPPEGGGH